MSNLSDLLKDLGLAECKASGFFGDLLGTLADIGGAYGLVQALLDAGQPSLSDIQTAIQNLGVQLGRQNEANQILSRNNTLNQDIGVAYGQLQTIVAEVNAQPSPPEIVLFIQPCVDALLFLAGPTQPDIVWNLTADWPIYWDDTGQYYSICFVDTPVGIKQIERDVGYHVQAPRVNPDGITVFYHTYSLPLYLFAVSILITVGGSLDPNFVVNYEPSLTKSVSVLQEKYGTILSGIRTLLPFDWRTRGSITSVACANPPPPQPVAGITLIYNASGMAGIASIEYGAVELYSGYSSMRDKYLLTLDGLGQPQPGTYNKLLLRIQKRWMDVYFGVGLGKVWETINALNRLLGVPAVPDPFAYWSFRWIFENLPSPAGFSFRALASFLITTEPLDTPYSNPAAAVSFRQLLNYPVIIVP